MRAVGAATAANDHRPEATTLNHTSPRIRRLRLQAALVTVALVTGACVTATRAPEPVSGEPVAATPAAATPAASTPATAATAAESVPLVAASSSPATATGERPPATGLTSAGSGSSLIGYMSMGGSEWYIHDTDEGMRNAADAAGVDLVECDPGGTRDGVQRCAAELAEAGVDGLISMQPFADLTDEVCVTLGDVPVVGIIYDQGPCQVSLLEVDQGRSGRLAGEALGALAADRWGCAVRAYVELASGPGDVVGTIRLEGFRQGYREHCELPRQQRTLNAAQHLITAKTRMGKLLEKVSGKPIVVAGVTDLAVLGAREAALEQGRGGQVWAAGQLADPAARQAIACDSHYVASVAQFPERFGDQVVPALQAAIAGLEIAPRMEAALELVTPDNVRTLFPDTEPCDT